MPTPKHTKEEQKTLEKMGQTLKKYRIKAGYSSYEVFAYENDISRTQYGAYESGKSNITLTKLTKILKGMKVSLAEFSKEMEK